MLASREPRSACHACGHAFAAGALFCPNCGTAKKRDTDNDLLLGTTVGDRYSLKELIGTGASGTIYRAEHVTLRRRVAVKVLHHELSRDDLAIERFRRQATTVGEIENDHIVAVHDFGRAPDGRLYIAMEYLEGETLAERLEQTGPLPVEAAVDVLIQLGEALIESHAIGYVHRDLRPRNLFLAVRRGEANFLKLLDFGLSKLVASEGEAATTSLGMTFGDPHYMSPEQARGEPIDRRADIYSMGCIAYQMLTGEPPFSGGRVFDVLTRHVEEEPEPPSARRAEIPEWLDQLILRCLAKRPSRRFVTVYRVVEALRQGLATGEIMDEERARKRETEVPPSVSRVWALLADRLDGDRRVEDADDTRFGADTDVTDVGRQTVLGVGAAGSRPYQGPSAGLSAKIVTPVTDDLTEPSPAPDMSDGIPAPVASEPTPAPRPNRKLRPMTKLPAVKLEVPEEDGDDPDDMRATRAVAGKSAAKSSAPPELLEEEGDDDAELYDDSDEYDYDYDDDDDDAEGSWRDSGAESRAGISGAWYADGDALGDSDSELAAADAAKLREARRAKAGRDSAGMSTTDEIYYDEGTGKLKWVIAAVAGAVAVIAIVLIARGGSDDGEVAAPVAADAAVVAVVDAVPVPVVAADAAAAEVTPDAAPTPRTAIEKPEVAVAAKPERAKPERAKPERAKPERPKPEKPDKPPKNRIDVGLDEPEPDKPDEPDEPASGSSDDDRRRADFFAQVGRKHLAGGNIPAAAKEFRKALKLDPSNGRAVTGLGQIALRQGSYRAAIKHLERAARLRSGSASVHTMLGEAYLGAGNRGAATKAFQRALRLDPDSKQARRGLAESGGAQ